MTNNDDITVSKISNIKIEQNSNKKPTNKKDTKTEQSHFKKDTSTSKQELMINKQNLRPYSEETYQRKKKVNKSHDTHHLTQALRATNMGQMQSEHIKSNFSKFSKAANFHMLPPIDKGNIVNVPTLQFPQNEVNVRRQRSQDKSHANRLNTLPQKYENLNRTMGIQDEDIPEDLKEDMMRASAKMDRVKIQKPVLRVKQHQTIKTVFKRREDWEASLEAEAMKTQFISQLPTMAVTEPTNILTEFSAINHNIKTEYSAINQFELIPTQSAIYNKEINNRYSNQTNQNLTTHMTENRSTLPKSAYSLQVPRIPTLPTVNNQLIHNTIVNITHAFDQDLESDPHKSLATNVTFKNSMRQKLQAPRERLNQAKESAQYSQIFYDISKSIHEENPMSPLFKPADEFETHLQTSHRSHMFIENDKLKEMQIVKHLLYGPELTKDIVDKEELGFNLESNQRLKKFIKYYRSMFTLDVFDQEGQEENMDKIIDSAVDENMEVSGLSWRVTWVENHRHFKWEEVKVVSYNPHKNIYRVRFNDGFIKKVDRLGLLFRGEDAARFIWRVDNSRWLKYKAEKVSIMDFFLNTEMPVIFHTQLPESFDLTPFLALLSSDILRRKVGKVKWNRSVTNAGSVLLNAVPEKLKEELNKLNIYSLMKSILLWNIREKHAIQVIMQLHLPIHVQSKPERNQDNFIALSEKLTHLNPEFLLQTQDPAWQSINQCRELVLDVCSELLFKLPPDFRNGSIHFKNQQHNGIQDQEKFDDLTLNFIDLSAYLHQFLDEKQKQFRIRYENKIAEFFQINNERFDELMYEEDIMKLKQTVLINSKQWTQSYVERSLQSMLKFFYRQVKNFKEYPPMDYMKIDQTKEVPQQQPLLHLKLKCDKNMLVHQEPSVSTIITEIENVAMGIVAIMDESKLQDKLMNRYYIKKVLTNDTNNNYCAQLFTQVNDLTKLLTQISEDAELAISRISKFEQILKLNLDEQMKDIRFRSVVKGGQMDPLLELWDKQRLALTIWNETEKRDAEVDFDHSSASLPNLTNLDPDLIANNVDKEKLENVRARINELTDEDITISIIRDEVTFFEEEQYEVLNEIPDQYDFHLYRCDFSTIKQMLLNKCIHFKETLIEVANKKCIVQENKILDNYQLNQEKLQKNPENIDEIERIIQHINQTRDSGSGHKQLNESNLEAIKEFTDLMDEFRFVRSEEEAERHREAVLAALKFERWLQNRISTLMTFSNNFQNNILDLMYEILSNLNVQEREIKELIKTKLFSTETEQFRAKDETNKIKAFTKDIFVKEQYEFLENKKVDEEISPFLVNLKQIKENSRKIKEMNKRFEKASQDFLRLSTKETLFTSKQLEVDETLKAKEKALIETFKKSKKQSIKAITMNLHDLDCIWLMLNDVCQLLHSVFDSDIEILDIHSLDNNVARWRSELTQVITNGLYDQPECKQNIDFIDNKLKSLKVIILVVSCLTSDKLRNRHFEELTRVLKFEVNPRVWKFQNIKFLISKGILRQENYETVLEVAEKAKKEFQIEEEIESIDREWSEIKFELKQDDNMRIHKLCNIERVLEVIENHGFQIQTIQTSLQVRPFLLNVLDWERKLSVVAEVVDEWIRCQKNQVQLEPVFAMRDSDEKERAMLKNYQEQDDINMEWKQVMEECFEAPGIMLQCRKENALTMLTQLNQRFESLFKGLNEQFDSKRKLFWRFYLLDDEDVMEILSIQKNYSYMNKIISKMYDNVSKVVTSPDLTLKGITSHDEETIEFFDGIKIKNETFENIMISLDQLIQKTLKTQFFRYADKQIIDQELKEFMESSTQIQVLNQIYSCNQYASNHIREESFKRETVLEDFDKVLQYYHIHLKKALTYTERNTLESTSTMLQQQRDTYADLASNTLADTDCFEWASTIKQEVDGQDQLQFSLNHVKLEQNFDFLGSRKALVLNPGIRSVLSFLSINQFCHYPTALTSCAGSGKTEIFKEQSRYIGRNSYFMQEKTLENNKMQVGNIFKCLYNSGMLLCIEDIQHHSTSSLSLVANYIELIFNSIHNASMTINVDGEDYSAGNKFYGIAVTASFKYISNNDIKSLGNFRTLQIQPQSIHLIIEYSLFSLGQERQKAIALKVKSMMEVIYSLNHNERVCRNTNLRNIKNFLGECSRLMLTCCNVKQDEVLDQMREKREERIKHLSMNVQKFTDKISEAQSRRSGASKNSKNNAELKKKTYRNQVGMTNVSDIRPQSFMRNYWPIFLNDEQNVQEYRLVVSAFESSILSSLTNNNKTALKELLYNNFNLSPFSQDMFEFTTELKKIIDYQGYNIITSKQNPYYSPKVNEFDFKVFNLDYRINSNVFNKAEVSNLETQCNMLIGMLNSRPGIIMSGRIASGKTTIIELCANALNQIREHEIQMHVKEIREKSKDKNKVQSEEAYTEEEYQEVKKLILNQGCNLFRIDPNMATKDVLLGNWENNGHQRLGFLFNLLKSIQPEKQERTRGLSWLVFDGKMDKEWYLPLLNMVSDSGKLILPNRQNLSLHHLTSLLFETDSLAHADHSVVTKAGILHIRDDQILPKNLFQHFLQSRMSRLMFSHYQFIVIKFDFLQDVLQGLFDDQGLLENLSALQLVQNTIQAFYSFIDELQYLDMRKKQVPSSWKHNYKVRDNQTFNVRLLHFFTYAEKSVFKNIDRQDFLYGFVNNEDKMIEFTNKIEVVLEGMLLNSLVWGFMLAIEDGTIQTRVMHQFREITCQCLLQKLEVVQTKEELTNLDKEAQSQLKEVFAGQRTSLVIMHEDDYANWSKLHEVNDIDRMKAIDTLPKDEIEVVSWLKEKHLFDKIIPLSNQIPQEESGITLWWCSQQFKIKKYQNNSNFTQQNSNYSLYHIPTKQYQFHNFQQENIISSGINLLVLGKSSTNKSTSILQSAAKNFTDKTSIYQLHHKQLYYMSNFKDIKSLFGSAFVSDNVRSVNTIMNYKPQEDSTRIVLFVDDLHAPRDDVENWGRSQHLLRSMVDLDSMPDFHNVKISRQQDYSFIFSSSINKPEHKQRIQKLLRHCYFAQLHNYDIETYQQIQSNMFYCSFAHDFAKTHSEKVGEIKEFILNFLIGVEKMITPFKDKLLLGKREILEENLKLYEILKCVREIDMYKYSSEQSELVCYELYYHQSNMMLLPDLKVKLIDLMNQLGKQHFSHFVELSQDQDDVWGQNIMRVENHNALEETSIETMHFGTEYSKVTDIQQQGEHLTEMIKSINEDMAQESTIHFNISVLGVVLDQLLQVIRSLRRPRSNLALIGNSGIQRLSLVSLAQRMLHQDNQVLEFKLKEKVAITRKFNISDIGFDKFYSFEKFQECILLINNKIKNKQKHNIMCLHQDREINLQVFDYLMRILGNKNLLDANNSQTNKDKSDVSMEQGQDYLNEYLHIVTILDQQDIETLDTLSNFSSLARNSHILQFTKWDQDALPQLASVVTAPLPGTDANLAKLTCDMFQVWDKFTEDQNIMENIKQRLIQKQFLEICKQMQSFFAEKNEKQEEAMGKQTQCRSQLESKVIRDDSNNQGLESSKPLQSRMKMQQKDLLVSIIRNLESIEAIKAEFANLQKGCNDIANTILMLKREIEEKQKNTIPAIKQVDKQLLSLGEKDQKVITRLKQPRAWMLTMFDIFIEVVRQRKSKTQGKSTFVWDITKLMVLDKEFYAMLARVELEKIPENIYLKLTKFVNETDNATREKIRDIRLTCQLFNWLIAVDQFQTMNSTEIETKRLRIAELQKQFDQKQAELNEVHGSINKQKEVIESKKGDQDNLRKNKQGISDEISGQEEGLNKVYHINFLINKLIDLYSAKIDSYRKQSVNEGWKFILAIFQANLARYLRYNHRQEVLQQWMNVLEQNGIEVDRNLDISGPVAEYTLDYLKQARPLRPVNLNWWSLIKAGLNVTPCNFENICLLEMFSGHVSIIVDQHQANLPMIKQQLSHLIKDDKIVLMDDLTPNQQRRLAEYISNGMTILYKLTKTPPNKFLEAIIASNIISNKKDSESHQQNFGDERVNPEINPKFSIILIVDRQVDYLWTARLQEIPIVNMVPDSESIEQHIDTQLQHLKLPNTQLNFWRAQNSYKDNDKQLQKELDQLTKTLLNPKRNSILQQESLKESSRESKQPEEEDEVNVILQEGTKYFNLQDDFHMDKMNHQDLIDRYKLFTTKLKELSYFCTKQYLFFTNLYQQDPKCVQSLELFMGLMSHAFEQNKQEQEEKFLQIMEDFLIQIRGHFFELLNLSIPSTIKTEVNFLYSIKELETSDLIHKSHVELILIDDFFTHFRRDDFGETIKILPDEFNGWLSASQQMFVQKLSKIEPFTSIKEILIENKSEWEEWANSPNVNERNPPHNFYIYSAENDSLLPEDSKLRELKESRWSPNPFKNYQEKEPSKEKYKKQLIYIALIECLLVKLLKPSMLELSIKNFIKIANEINEEKDLNEDEKEEEEDTHVNTVLKYTKQDQPVLIMDENWHQSMTEHWKLPQISMFDMKVNNWKSEELFSHIGETIKSEHKSILLLYNFAQINEFMWLDLIENMIKIKKADFRLILITSSSSSLPKYFQQHTQKLYFHANISSLNSFININHLLRDRLFNSPLVTHLRDCPWMNQAIHFLCSFNTFFAGLQSFQDQNQLQIQPQDYWLLLNLIFLLFKQRMKIIEIKAKDAQKKEFIVKEVETKKENAEKKQQHAKLVKEEKKEEERKREDADQEGIVEWEMGNELRDQVEAEWPKIFNWQAHNVGAHELASIQQLFTQSSPKYARLVSNWASVDGEDPETPQDDWKKEKSIIEQNYQAPQMASFQQKLDFNLLSYIFFSHQIYNKGLWTQSAFRNEFVSDIGSLILQDRKDIDKLAQEDKMNEIQFNSKYIPHLKVSDQIQMKQNLHINSKTASIKRQSIQEVQEDKYLRDQLYEVQKGCENPFMAVQLFELLQKLSSTIPHVQGVKMDKTTEALSEAWAWQDFSTILTLLDKVDTFTDRIINYIHNNDISKLRDNSTQLIAIMSNQIPKDWSIWGIKEKHLIDYLNIISTTQDYYRTILSDLRTTEQDCSLILSFDVMLDCLKIRVADEMKLEIENLEFQLKEIDNLDVELSSQDFLLKNYSGKKHVLLKISEFMHSGQIKMSNYK